MEVQSIPIDIFLALKEVGKVDYIAIGRTVQIAVEVIPLDQFGADGVVFAEDIEEVGIEGAYYCEYYEEADIRKYCGRTSP